MKTTKAAFVRASISFPTEIYQSLETLAKTKKVSLAWVVREDAERYVAEEQPEGGESASKPVRAAAKQKRGTK